MSMTSFPKQPKAVFAFASRTNSASHHFTKVLTSQMALAPLAFRRLAALCSEVARREKMLDKFRALDFATLSEVMDIVSRDPNNFWFTNYTKEIHALSVDYSSVWNPGDSHLFIYTGFFGKDESTFIIDPSSATLNVTMGPNNSPRDGVISPDLVLHASSLREQQQRRLSSTVIHQGQNFSVRTFEPAKQEVHTKVPDNHPRKSMIVAGVRKNTVSL